VHITMMPKGDYFIRCGFGRKERRWWHDGAPADFVLASTWEELREATLATDHARFDAADLDGRTVGAGFLEHVIRDPKVQAAGKWLCLERPIFGPLFAEGKFPVVVERDGFRRNHPTRRLPRYANVGYADVKERLRGLPRGTLSNFERLEFPSPATLSSLVWDPKWPVVLDADELTRIVISQYSVNANYQSDPLEGPIYHAAKALADRHQAFFQLLRSGLLVVEGLFRESGQQLPVSLQQWDRKDRQLDVRSSDLLDEVSASTAMWESMALRLPGQEGSTKRRRPRPAERALEAQLKKRGLADGRRGRPDIDIAHDLVDQRLTGEELDRAVDRKRKQIKRYYERRGHS
jgi:hypothetical protein